jgi:transposase-like protein
MAPREHFTGPVPGLACPLCLSTNYTLVAARDPKRGIAQTVYRCGDCKSYFGDAREPEAGADGSAGN